MQSGELHQRFVLGDWGTSRLRLSLIENDRVVARCAGPGIGALTVAPAIALAELIAPWRNANEPLNVLLSGMAGSRHGLIEVPYARAPASLDKWCKAAMHIADSNLTITIAAGLRTADQVDAADVMRGEETQIFGALQIDPALGTGSRLFVLPGTHSKWAIVDQGVVTRFRTAVTGEAYALLRDHSTLLRAGRLDGDPVADSNSGFDAGLNRSMHLTEGLLAALFETRTAQLLDQRSQAWGSGFLSALLIGSEIASLRTTYAATRIAHIVGDPTLAAAYARVFAGYGIASQLLNGDDCAIAGLCLLRQSLQET